MFSRFFFSIDTKSLYWGVENDNEKGHTPTVSTNLRQGSITKPELRLFVEHESNIELDRENSLIDELLKNSKSACRINNVLIFNNIFVNGTKINCKSQYCIYLKEEIDDTKIQFGRIKAHYPTSLRYYNDGMRISNRDVLESVYEALHGFAYLVRGFEVGPGSRINFIVSLLGYGKVAYSKVFLNYRGGNTPSFSKVFNEYAESYDYEIFTMRKGNIPGIDEVTADNYSKALEYCSELANQLAFSYLKEKYKSGDIFNFSCLYPYAPYDFEIRDNERTYFYLVFNTTTRMDYFYLNAQKNILVNNFRENTFIVLIKDVLGKKPLIQEFSIMQIENMNREVALIKYFGE